jgi:uncharacterized YkwD family protein
MEMVKRLFLILFICFLVACGVDAKQVPIDTETEINQLSQLELEIVELTNEERRKHGLDPLEVDLELSEVARIKSRDMAVNNYFSHTSPTYGSPFDMMNEFGVFFFTAGENLAKGQDSAEIVVKDWMQSEGHRKNILDGNFKYIGIGYVDEGNHWTQMFIGNRKY